MSIDNQISQQIQARLPILKEVKAAGINVIKTLSFGPYHKPNIYAGNYQIELKHTMTVSTGDVKDPLDHKKIELLITGHRFNMPEQDIHMVYPPKHTYGEYDKTLPYIILNRDMIPWEREFAFGNKGTDEDQPSKEQPWLALLVFQETEAALATTTLVDPTTLGYLPEAGANMPAQVQLLDLTNYKIKPKQVELKLLTHRIETTDTNGDKSDRVVLLANRLPLAAAGSSAKPEKTIVHLVSLEKGLDHQDKFISLYNWSFNCQASSKSFERLAAVTSGNFTLKHPKLNRQMSAGFVPMLHHIKDGTKTVSWFHGPLVAPFQNGQRPTISRTDPLRGEDFLQFDTKSRDQGHNMLDVSYAAAWELGRLLTLEEQNIAMDLFRYKRKHGQAEKTRQALANSSIPVISLMEAPDWPPSVEQWLNDLFTLKVVPSNYLLPHPTMLPLESIQFFRLDLNWIYHLQLGALTVGEAWEKPRPDAQNDTISWIDRNQQYTDKTGKKIRPKCYTGVLIRSQVFADYEDVIIEGYDFEVNLKKPIDNTKQMLKVIERKIDNQTLLCIFQGDNDTDVTTQYLKNVICYRHAKAMHYGFRMDELEDTLFKDIKNIDGDTIVETTLAIETELNKDTRQLDISLLWANIKAKSTDIMADPYPPAQFGFKMTEGYPKYRFTVPDKE